VEGIYRLLFADFHEPVNCGNPNEISILDFAKEIQRLSDRPCEIVFKPLPQDDPKVRRPDITRARTLLGWEPQIDRHEGMKRTMEYFKRKV
jgi:dTDP-glucose 4,6-dehydratase